MTLANALIALFFVPHPAAASNRVGNGGDSVVCRKSTLRNQITSAVLLDIYESKPEIVTSSLPYTDQIKNIIDRLEKLSPEQAAIYRRRNEKMSSEIEFVRQRELANVKDSEHLIRPTEKDCTIEQVAIRKNLVTDDKRFLINEKIWSSMDNTSKAGLLLHEIVYEHLSKLGEEDSVKTRHLVALFLSEDFAKMDKSAYWKKIESLKLPIYR